MTEKTKIDLDALECVARAAKPGRWTWKQVGSFSTPGCVVLWPDTSKGGVHYRRIDSGGGMEQADADFIANFSPAVVLELIRRLREPESKLHEVERLKRPWKGMDSAPRDRRIIVRSESGTIYAAHWVANPLTGEESYLVSEAEDGTQHLVDPVEWKEI